jgi:hypothetical protein
MRLPLSNLAHTWLIDVDGTILCHNGHKQGGDALLPGVHEFWATIPPGDTIVLMSAREETYREATLAFLEAAGLRFDYALFGLPHGERILINDVKPRGLHTALAVNLRRDGGLAELRIDAAHEGPLEPSYR